MSILIVSPSNRNSRIPLPYQIHIVQLFKHILQYMLSEKESSVYLTYIYIIKASFPRFNIMFTSAYFEQSSYLFKLEMEAFSLGLSVWTMNFTRLKYCFSKIVDSLVGFSNESLNQLLIQVLQLKMIFPARNQRKTFFNNKKAKFIKFSANFQSSKTVIRGKKFFAVFH